MQDASTPITPDELVRRLLYRDGLMLVIDKPAGLPVHAGPKGGPNLTAALDALSFGLPKPPALAHRLDRDTSGCLVLGRHRDATAKLGRLFAQSRVEKTYLAVLAGTLPEPEGRVDAPLARRSPDPRSWWMKVSLDGQPALTGWRVLAQADGLTVAELSPQTGRTHQLRVHMAHLGCPIVGDAIYGDERARTASPSLHLHAWKVVVPLRQGKPPVAVEAPPPEHMRALLAPACLP